VIDEVSVDQLLDAHGVGDTDRARSVVQSWRQYLDEHRDEITAWQVLYSRPGAARNSFAELRELAERIKRPPHHWTMDLIWKAYEVLEVDRVTHADRHTVTDLVSLIRFTLGEDEHLVPYAAKVHERYAAWPAQQHQAGAVFTDRGGVDGALGDLGDDAAAYLDQLNTELTA
jgi:type I restriction enzyme R subunit